MTRVLVVLLLAVAALLATRSAQPRVSLGAPNYAARGALIHDRNLLERAAQVWAGHSASSGGFKALWAGRQGEARLVVLEHDGAVMAVRFLAGVATLGPPKRFDSADAFVPIGGQLLLSDAFQGGLVDTPAGALLADRAVFAPALLGHQVPLLVLPAGPQLYVPPGHEAAAMRTALRDERDGPLVVAALRAAGSAGRFAVLLGRADVIQSPSGRGIGARAVGVVVAGPRGARPTFAVGYREREGAPARGELIGAPEARRPAAIAERVLRPGWLAIAGDPRIARLRIDTDAARLDVHGRFAIVDPSFAGDRPAIRGFTTGGLVVRPAG